MSAEATGRRLLRGGQGAEPSAQRAEPAPPTALSARAKLSVFLHATVKTRHFEEMFRQALSNVEVVAYSRFGDLVDAVRNGSDAVLALKPVLREQGLPVSAEGLRLGAGEERYVLVSTREVEPLRLTSVGAIDLLGRRGTQGFVHERLKASPRVQAVSKFEDLLPLLQLDMVEAIFVPERWVGIFRAGSKLPLKVSAFATLVGLPALAVVRPGAGELVTRIKALGPELDKEIGVDAWR